MAVSKQEFIDQILIAAYSEVIFNQKDLNKEEFYKNQIKEAEKIWEIRQQHIKKSGICVKEGCSEYASERSNYCFIHLSQV